MTYRETDVRLHTEKVHKLTALGSQLLEDKRYQEAFAAFKDAWLLTREHGLKDLMLTLVRPFSRSLYLSHNYKEGIQFHRDIIALAKEKDDNGLLAHMLTGLGALLWFVRQPNEAYDVLLKARQACLESNDKDMMLKVLINLALVQSSRNHIQESLTHYRELLALSEDMGAEDAMLHALLNMQALYIHQEDYTRANDVSEEAIALANKLGNRESLIGILSNKASVLQKQDKFEEALRVNLEVLEMTEDTNTKPHWMANLLLNIGLAYSSLKQYNEAEVFLLRSIKTSNEYPEQCYDSLVRAHVNLAIIYTQIERLDEAETLYHDIMEHLERIEIGRDRVKFMRYYANLLTRRGKHEEANQILGKALEASQFHYDEKLTEGIANAQASMDHQAKVREAQLLKRKNEELKQKNSELQQALDSLHQAQDTIRQLEHRNTVFAMAVTTNHELNQPLMIIRGNLDLLHQSGAIENSNATRYIERITEATQRIESILKKYRTAERSTVGLYSEDTPMVTFDGE